jgi:hypothetical protein
MKFLLFRKRARENAMISLFCCKKYDYAMKKDVKEFEVTTMNIFLYSVVLLCYINSKSNTLVR